MAGIVPAENGGGGDRAIRTRPAPVPAITVGTMVTPSRLRLQQPPWSGHNSSPVSYSEWKTSGRLVYYNPDKARITAERCNQRARRDDKAVACFERVELTPEMNVETGGSSNGNSPHHSPHTLTTWCTFLPSFVDGSFGYAATEQELQASKRCHAPRLYVDFPAMGHAICNSEARSNSSGSNSHGLLSWSGSKDSSTMLPESSFDHTVEQRANLVEALWRDHGIRSTVLIARDYSFLVALELLRRQPSTRIEHVLLLDAPLYATGTASSPRIPESNDKTVKSNDDAVLELSRKLAALRVPPPPALLFPPLGAVVGSKAAQQKRRHCQAMQNLLLAAIREHESSASDNESDGGCWNIKRLFLKTCADQGITLHIVGHVGHPLSAHTQRARDELEAFRPDITVELLAPPLPDAPRSEGAGLLVENLLFKAANARPAFSIVRQSVFAAHGTHSATRSSSSSSLSSTSGQQQRPPLVREPSERRELKLH